MMKIAIIGTLVALLLPAIQAARESARRLTPAHFAFCDGSVHAIRYDIDRTLFNYLGNRRDRHAVSPECCD